MTYKLYIFQAHNTMLLYLHTLQSDHNMSSSPAIFLATTSLGLGLFPHTEGFSLRLLSICSLLPQDPTGLQQRDLWCGSSRSACTAALILQHGIWLRKCKKWHRRKTKKNVSEMRCRTDSTARSMHFLWREVGAAYPSLHRPPKPLVFRIPRPT